MGNGALTAAEQRAHFALWALMKAPLLIGTDLRAAPPRVKAVLLAAEVLAVNQDDLGVAADLVWKQGPNEARVPIYSKLKKFQLLLSHCFVLYLVRFLFYLDVGESFIIGTGSASPEKLDVLAMWHDFASWALE